MVELALTGFILGSIIIHIFDKYSTIGEESFLETLSFILMGMVLLSIFVDFIQLVFDLVRKLTQNSNLLPNLRKNNS